MRRSFRKSERCVEEEFAGRNTQLILQDDERQQRILTFLASEVVDEERYFAGAMLIF
jgi:hypothetical protein